MLTPLPLQCDLLLKYVLHFQTHQRMHELIMTNAACRDDVDVCFRARMGRITHSLSIVVNMMILSLYRCHKLDNLQRFTTLTVCLQVLFFPVSLRQSLCLRLSLSSSLYCRMGAAKGKHVCELHEAHRIHFQLAVDQDHRGRDCSHIL